MLETSGLRTRVSPLIVVLAAIAVMVVGTAGYLLVRPHPRRVFAAGSSADSDEPAAQWVAPSPAPPPVMAAPVAPPPPSPPLERPQPPAVSSPEPTARETQNAAVKKRALLMADHNQRVRLESDERAFESLQLPDPVRAAIRQINATHVRTMRDAIEANAAASSPGEQLGANVAKNDESDRARRAALREVLGADGVAAFETAEHAAARRLRRQYSAQWAQELEQEAPLPEGLPPSPH
jgi:hypothetical protein